MANLTYTSSNSSIYGGKFAPTVVPSWVSNLPLHTYGTVPTTNTLSDLNPQSNPSLNPRYTENPSDPPRPEWMGGDHSQTIDAWNTMLVDSITKKAFIPLVSGHGDGAGGEIYTIDFNSETPTWSFLLLPTGVIGDETITNDNQEQSGKYANGRWRAKHGYNAMAIVPNQSIVVPILGNVSWDTNFSTSLGGELSLDTGLPFKEWGGTEPGAAPSHPESAVSSGSGTIYDPTRDCVWYRGRGTGRFVRRNRATDTWEIIGSSGAGSGQCSLQYMPDYDCLLVAKFFDDTTSYISIFDCATGVRYPKTVAGTLVGISNLGNGKQFHRVDAQTYATWDNDSDTTAINQITFTGDPRTATDFTVSQMPVAGTNSVVPTVKTLNGTFGRFFHIEEWGIFGILNATNQSIYIYRYKAI